MLDATKNDYTAGTTFSSGTGASSNDTAVISWTSPDPALQVFEAGRYQVSLLYGGFVADASLARPPNPGGGLFASGVSGAASLGGFLFGLALDFVEFTPFWGQYLIPDAGGFNFSIMRAQTIDLSSGLFPGGGLPLYIYPIAYILEPTVAVGITDFTNVTMWITRSGDVPAAI